MEFYPYKLFILEKREPTYDEGGFLVEEAGGFVFVGKCRNYASGSGNITNVETKEIVRYSSVVVMPLSCPDIAENTAIEVRDKDQKIRLKGNVTRFERNQLHCRIWV